jgi:hypothetical protein
MIVIAVGRILAALRTGMVFMSTSPPLAATAPPREIPRGDATWQVPNVEAADGARDTPEHQFIAGPRADRR